MTSPTGLIFAMRSRFTSQIQRFMFDEADTDFSGRNAAVQAVDGYSSTANSGHQTTTRTKRLTICSTFTKGTAMTTLLKH